MCTRSTYIMDIYMDRIHITITFCVNIRIKRYKSSGMYRRITISSVSVDDGVVIKRLIWQVLHYSQVLYLQHINNGGCLTMCYRHS